MLSKDRNTLIEQAFINAGIVELGSDISSEEMTKASYTLNSMIKSWENEGFHIWKEKDGYLLCEAGKTKYILGGDNSDVCTEQFYESEISSVSIAPIYKLTLSDISDLSVGDTVMIYTDTNTVLTRTITEIENYEITFETAIEEDLSLGNLVFYGTNLVSSTVNTEVSSGTLELIVNDASNMSEGDIIYLVNDSEWVSRTISSINSNTLTLNNTISVVAADSLVFVAANLVKTDLSEAAIQIRNGLVLTDDIDLSTGWKIGLYNTPVDTSVESSITWFNVDNIVNDLIILDSVIADDIIAEGDVLYYKENISRPNDIDSISYIENLSDSYENPVNKVARKTYLSYTDKKSLGSPIAAYFNRDKEESSIYLYNTPDKKYFVKFSFQKTFDIFSGASDLADFPDEYVSCIIWNLALELGIIYKIPDLANIQVQADKLKNIAQSWDNEMVSFSISPEICD